MKKSAINLTSDHIRKFLIALGLSWSLMIVVSLVWNFIEIRQAKFDVSMEHARTLFKKDLLLRHWAAAQGGVYVPVSQHIQPNPWLTEVEERDIVTPSGRTLTLMNPAYINRKIYEMDSRLGTESGHITSLNPIRPKNKADDWEKDALKRFDAGETEVYSIVDKDEGQALRLMGAMVTTKACLSCHAQQGYKEGDIRGGISVKVPLADWTSFFWQDHFSMLIGHLLLWLFGILAIIVGGKNLSRQNALLRQTQNDLAEANKNLEKKVVERTAQLEASLAEIKQLGGLLPICSHCKKIRDDKGYWNQVEVYISKHSEADFSHSICPTCMVMHYGEFEEDDEE